MAPRRFLCVLLLLGLVAVTAVPVVTAKNCEARNTLSVWKHGGGMFRRMPSPGARGTFVWKEFDNSWNVLATFQESMRDVAQQQVVLVDKERGVSILLRTDVCGIRQTDEQQFQKLYGGTWMRVVDCT